MVLMCNSQDRTTNASSSLIPFEKSNAAIRPSSEPEKKACGLRAWNSQTVTMSMWVSSNRCKTCCFRLSQNQTVPSDPPATTLSDPEQQYSSPEGQVNLRDYIDQTMNAPTACLACLANCIFRMLKRTSALFSHLDSPCIPEFYCLVF